MTMFVMVGGYELSDDNDDVATPLPKIPIAPSKPSAFKYPSGNRQPALNPPLAPNPPPARPQPTRPVNIANKSNASVKQGGCTTLPTPPVELWPPVKHVQSKGKERAAQNQVGPSQPSASPSCEHYEQISAYGIWQRGDEHTAGKRGCGSARGDYGEQSGRISRSGGLLTSPHVARAVQLELNVHTLQTTQSQAAQGVVPAVWPVPNALVTPESVATPNLQFDPIIDFQ
ncbi:hypothetical protein FRC09_019341 [Ceratobasidium sp. 395]|nr:hypothetical protein FRC09_019341 [Ceratobasidium sp. 395]